MVLCGLEYAVAVVLFMCPRWNVSVCPGWIEVVLECAYVSWMDGGGPGICLFVLDRRRWSWNVFVCPGLIRGGPGICLCALGGWRSSWLCGSGSAMFLCVLDGVIIATC